ncbi:MAG: hypothetical protein K9L75_02925, partial [Spirochaetia bacterium]|nr:hypothetical protein [Spirochaetia bacterium]
MKLELIDVPRKFLPEYWKKEHDIKLLVINGKCEALEFLVKHAEDSKNDIKKLLSTLKIQLSRRDLIEPGPRLKHYDKNYEILEFKSNRGHSRLYGFFDVRRDSVIICTNGFWKTKGKHPKQTAAFKRANRL